MQPDLSREILLWKNGYHVMGVDEVGRGSLAGPVFAAAFYLVPTTDKAFLKQILLLGINDSKKLSPIKRQEIYQTLHSMPVEFEVSSSSVNLINQIGIVEATQRAMGTAVKKLYTKVGQKKSFVLSDGFKLTYADISELDQEGVIHGDAKHVLISAASIIAKVERDTYMKQLSYNFPEYAWEANKGYGTRSHRNAILEYGLTPHHRTLFVRNILTATSE